MKVKSECHTITGLRLSESECLPAPLHENVCLKCYDADISAVKFCDFVTFLTGYLLSLSAAELCNGHAVPCQSQGELFSS